jgi:hypothetical protein
MMATLACSASDEAQLTVDTFANIVVSVQQYVISGCVFFLCPATAGKFHTFFFLTEKQISYFF